MNSCDGYRQALSARLDGEDPGMAEDALKAHLLSCADCRAWVDAAERLSTYEVVANASALHPAALTELLDEGMRRSRPHGVMGWRVALIVTAALQLGVTWLRLLADDGHAARELASLDLALAVGFLVLAWMPRRASGAFPVVAVMVVLLVGTSVINLLAGDADLGREATRVLQLAGLACLWMIARRKPREAVVVRLNTR